MMALVTNPVLSHEFRLVSRRWVRWFGRGYAHWYLTALICAYMLLLCAFTLASGGGAADTVVEFVLVGICILTPGMAAVTLASERQRGSWTLLTTSPLDPRELIFGKFLGRLLAVCALASLAVPVILAVNVGLTSTDALRDLALYGLPTAFGLTGLGLWCSARCRTLTGALLWAYGLTAALMAGVPLLYAALGSNSDEAWLTSPVIALGYHNQGPGYAWPCALFYLVLGAVGVLLPISRFEEWLRLEGEPKRRRRWRLDLIALEHERRRTRRWLRLHPRLTATVGVAWLAYAVCMQRSLAHVDLDRLLACQSTLAALLALVLGATLVHEPQRLAMRLRLRFGLRQYVRVQAQWVWTAALAGTAYLLALAPVALNLSRRVDPRWWHGDVPALALGTLWQLLTLSAVAVLLGVQIDATARQRRAVLTGLSGVTLALLVLGRHALWVPTRAFVWIYHESAVRHVPAHWSFYDPRRLLDLLDDPITLCLSSVLVIALALLVAQCPPSGRPAGARR